MIFIIKAFLEKDLILGTPMKVNPFNPDKFSLTQKVSFQPMKG
jgi:hypothetical protein